MKRTFNKEAGTKEDKLQPGPEWVDQAVIDMWERMIEKTNECNLTFSKIGTKYGFSASSIYNSITLYKNGGKPRDTDVWMIESIAKELKIPLNYLVHGNVEKPEHRSSAKVDSSVMDNIFSLSNGDLYALFIMTLPYLDRKQLNSIREDILSRFE